MISAGSHGTVSNATGERDLVLDGDGATVSLGAEIALFLKPGDVVTLGGDLGSGKTTFARAVIRAMAPDAGAFEVPSPTFTLAQYYDFTRIPMAHFDLYRITNAEEIFELGFDEAVASGAALIEWPERMAEFVPPDRLHLEFSFQRDDHVRHVRLTGHGGWVERLQRMTAINRFLAGTDWADAQRRHFQGDASARRYEQLMRADGTGVLLMDMPARSDSVAVHDGKPYSALVHLADDIGPVIALTDGLRGLGLAAPEIYHCDLDLGLALIEDLGGTVYGSLVPDADDTETAYEAACDVLVHLAASTCPPRLDIRGGQSHVIHAYDKEAMQFEAGLLLDWFWPEYRREPVSSSLRDGFVQVWNGLFGTLDLTHPVWVLRDFHSPNLLWRPDRNGLERVGVIDYQDAVMGHAAYDLASLLQDARIDVPEDREQRHLERYLRLRDAADRDFDADSFLAAYATLGAQRCTKILGIFARLNRRDGKPGYLRHIPRVSDYLERNLRHPALTGLSAWYDEHLPAKLRAKALQ